MNKRQAKKKRKKEQQKQQMVDLYAAIAELPAIARKIGEGLREALDRISEALSEIDVAEALNRLSETKKQHVTEIITPGNCVVCGEPITDDGLLLCQACREKNKEEQDGAQN